LMFADIEDVKATSIPADERRRLWLVVRIVGDHPLPDGNKRVGWQALTMFCALNDRELNVAADDAVTTMQSIAAGKLDEAAVAAWLAARLDA